MDHYDSGGDRGLLTLISAGLMFFILLRGYGEYAARMVLTGYGHAHQYTVAVRVCLTIFSDYRWRFERRKLG